MNRICNKIIVLLTLISTILLSSILTTIMIKPFVRLTKLLWDYFTLPINIFNNIPEVCGIVLLVICEFLFLIAFSYCYNVVKASIKAFYHILFNSRQIKYEEEITQEVLDSFNKALRRVVEDDINKNKDKEDKEQEDEKEE